MRDFNVFMIFIVFTFCGCGEKPGLTWPGARTDTPAAGPSHRCCLAWNAAARLALRGATRSAGGGSRLSEQDRAQTSPGNMTYITFSLFMIFIVFNSFNVFSVRMAPSTGHNPQAFRRQVNPFP